MFQFRYIKSVLIMLVFISGVCFSAQAQKNKTKENVLRPLESSPFLQKALDKAVAETLEKFASKGLKDENIAVSVIDLRDEKSLKTANFRGAVPIYPASVVKLFYMVAAHRWLEDGKINDTPELRRALRDMIVDSSNDATHQIVDILTDATGGSELTPAKLKKWAEKRNAVNRYFASLGYTGNNICQKTYCEDIYGRERQFWDGGKNRNKLTTASTARLMVEIALGKSVSPERSRQMLELLKREPTKSDNPDTQATDFTALAFTDKTNLKLWSKAGWTSTSRHDVAYFETPEGKKFVVCIFTEKFATEKEILPNIVSVFLREVSK